MYKPLAILPLHLACQFLVPQNCSNLDVSLAIDEPVPKSVTDLPDGYAVYRDFGVAYKNYKNLMQWDQARKTCVTDGGNLAVIDSFDKVAIVKGIADTNAVPWNGIHRLFDITEWTDVRSGLPTASVPWSRTTFETDLTRHCVALVADGSGAFATKCNELRAFVCEIPIFKE